MQGQVDTIVISCYFGYDARKTAPPVVQDCTHDGFDRWVAVVRAFFVGVRDGCFSCFCCAILSQCEGGESEDGKEGRGGEHDRRLTNAPTEWVAIRGD